jgi:hypothetical protein
MVLKILYRSQFFCQSFKIPLHPLLKGDFQRKSERCPKTTLIAVDKNKNSELKTLNSELKFVEFYFLDGLDNNISHFL